MGDIMKYEKNDKDQGKNDIGAEMIMTGREHLQKIISEIIKLI